MYLVSLMYYNSKKKENKRKTSLLPTTLPPPPNYFLLQISRINSSTCVRIILAMSKIIYRT